MTALVIAEAGWLIRRQLDHSAEALLSRSIAQDQIAVESLAERLDQTQVATLDERDFRIVRPEHTDAFELLPGPA